MFPISPVKMTGEIRIITNVNIVISAFPISPVKMTGEITDGEDDTEGTGFQ
jgi:hypothetical protein